MAGILPTEETLRTRFGVSRATVRAALSNIQADGLITRSPAIGSRVISVQERKAFQTGWNSVEDLLQYTKRVQLHVESVREMVVDERMASDLGFNPGRMVVQVAGIRWNKGETEVPLCYVEIYFDALYNGVAPSISVANKPVADLIEERYQIRIERIRQEIFAARLSENVATKLSAIEDDPGLSIVRWYFDGNNQMFETTRTIYPADRFRYVVEFGRSRD